MRKSILRDKIEVLKLEHKNELHILKRNQLIEKERLLTILDMIVQYVEKT